MSSSLPSTKTPIEVFNGRKNDLSNLKVFGCWAFRFVEADVKKLDSEAIKEILVGFGRTHGSYFWYKPVTRKMYLSRNVSFNEKEFIGVKSVEVEQCDILPEPEFLRIFPKKKMTLVSSQFPQVLKF